jgi:hypothetical protein
MDWFDQLLDLRLNCVVTARDYKNGKLGTPESHARKDGGKVGSQDRDHTSKNGHHPKGNKFHSAIQEKMDSWIAQMKDGQKREWPTKK